jgi:hypothetical protein
VVGKQMLQLTHLIQDNLAGIQARSWVCVCKPENCPLWLIVDLSTLGFANWRMLVIPSPD